MATYFKGTFGSSSSSSGLVRSRAWLEIEGGDADDDSKSKNDTKIMEQILDDVVTLKVGEALLFAPSAMVGTKTNVDQDTAIKRLGMEYLKISIRSRLTIDGGKSIMAV